MVNRTKKGMVFLDLDLNKDEKNDEICKLLN